MSIISIEKRRNVLITTQGDIFCNIPQLVSFMLDFFLENFSNAMAFFFSSTYSQTLNHSEFTIQSTLS